MSYRINLDQISLDADYSSPSTCTHILDWFSRTSGIGYVRFVSLRSSSTDIDVHEFIARILKNQPVGRCFVQPKEKTRGDGKNYDRESLEKLINAVHMDFKYAEESTEGIVFPINIERVLNNIEWACELVLPTSCTCCTKGANEKVVWKTTNWFYFIELHIES